MDRRLNYRVTPQIQEALRVDIIQDNQAIQVGLIDISAGGVGIALPGQGLPSLRPGATLNLRFQSDRLIEPLVITAEVRHREEEGSHTTYGLAFDAWGETRHSLEPKLRSLFNEREAVRVEPARDVPIPVTMKVNGGFQEFTCDLRDISALGLGLWADVVVRGAITQGDVVQLQFRLPDGSDDLRVKAEVRYLMEVAERLQVGVHMIEQQVPRTNEVRRSIIEFVMNRQIAVAREGRNPESAIDISN